ncbi:MAG TPA: ABC transporter permease, partial [Anaerolineales bacterium]|nr:ABC transporter permease [Anaerolineales bacterium]
MILKNLWRRKTRTLLTMLGIAVGVAAVVALSAFGEGFASGFESIFSSANADLTVGQKEAVMLLISAVDDSVGEEIANLPGVDDVAGTVIGVVQMPESPYFIVMGEDPRGFAMRHYRLVAGKPLTGRKQILLGKITAKNFDKQVGESFRLNSVTYRVVGIYETGVSMEDGGAVMSLADAQRAFDKRYRVSYFNVKVEDKREIDAIKQQIETRWPDLAAIRSGEATQQTEAINLYRSFGWFLGVFAVLVGGLGMMNTTLMSVLERTREIGVLRAMGWKSGRVVGMIMGESLALAFGGGLLGIALGIGLTQLARTAPAVESLLGSVFTPLIFAQALGTALLLGAVGGLFPAWRASRLAPVEAMRYDSGVGAHLGPVAGSLARLFGNSALRNLWRRPTRTLVTVVGVGIGVGFIVALIAIVEGFTTAFDAMAGAGEADLLAEQSNTSDLSLSVIDERVADRIATRPEVESVSKMIFGVSSAPGLPYFLVFGLDPSEELIRHFRVREGHLILRPGDMMLGRF